MMAFKLGKTSGILTIELKVGIETSREGKWYISSCPALDIVSQGETIKEAKEMIEDAIELFITSCIERGTLKEVLKDCGWVKVEQSLIKKQTRSQKLSDFVSIPFPIILPEAQKISGCHQ
jgi:predicted RNase H-like HicB family nuclease